MFNILNHYWQLADGRVWSTSAAAWVTAETAHAWAKAQGMPGIPQSPVDEAGERTERGLYDALVFYGLPVGALAPAPTREEARNTALAAIKQARDSRLENGGLVWQGYLVSVDKEATDRMTSTAVQFMAGALAEVRWKMSDGEYALLDKETFFAMSMAAGTLVQQCYGVEEVKRQQVLGLPNAEAVLAWLENPVNVRSGWPPDGGE